MARTIVALKQDETKLLLALALEHVEERAWKSGLLDSIVFELAYALFKENGEHVSPSDVPQLRAEAIRERQQKSGGF